MCRCQAIVTSPMYWAVTECFIIGEYTLSTNNARGWDTAERKCFDPQYANGRYYVCYQVAIFYFLKTAVTMTIFCQSFVLEETHSGKMLGFAFCRPLLAKITAPWQVRGT